MVQSFIRLTQDQSSDLFRQTGMFLRRLAISPDGCTAHVVDHSCKRCLLADDLPGVFITHNGLCNHCLEHEAEAASGAHSAETAASVIAQFRGSCTAKAQDCVLAYSGGKDSALAAIVAVRDYGLNPVAVLVDNGFIPEEVQDNSREFCNRLGILLRIERIDVRSQARENLLAGSNKIPCSSCIRGVFSAMARTSREFGVRLVISGHRFPPLAYPLTSFTADTADQNTVCVSPLLASRIQEADQLSLVMSMGWKKLAIAGNTSNCKLIGVVEESMFDRLGYNPHIYEVSKEIRGGIYDRAWGVKKVEKPTITPDHRQWVMERMA